VIFCRNTTIYFEPELQVQIWSRMAGLLEPGGMLYIGHSERIAASAAFRLVATTAYVRNPGEARQ
jgi:chemotaxis protein methyltransferase CheR